MRLTVSDIMTRVASTVNQEADSPDSTSTEFTLWLAYLNRSQDEWAEATDWEVTRKFFKPSVTGVSVASVALPLDFKNLAGPARIHFDSTTIVEEVPFINDEQKSFMSSTDKFVTIVGDNSSGRSLIFNPATLASGVSLQITYFSMPTALSTASQYPVVPDPSFLVDRTIAYIFEARSDPRFQLMESKARERLLNMVQMATEDKYSNFSNPNPVTNSLRRAGFRVGRD
jgi:hypothetical protein